MSRPNTRTTIKAVLFAAGLVLAPLGLASAQRTAPTKHHSILKGAVVGAVGGHMTHRRHGTLLGAAVGAEVQHHRNAVARKHMHK